MTTEPYEDWLTDFAAGALSDDALSQWHDASVGQENDRIRQLVAEAQCMRWAARILLDRLLVTSGGVGNGHQQDAELAFAIQLVNVRGPGA